MTDVSVELYRKIGEPPAIDSDTKEEGPLALSEVSEAAPPTVNELNEPLPARMEATVTVCPISSPTPVLR